MTKVDAKYVHFSPAFLANRTIPHREIIEAKTFLFDHLGDVQRRGANWETDSNVFQKNRSALVWQVVEGFLRKSVFRVNPHGERDMVCRVIDNMLPQTLGLLDFLLRVVGSLREER
jgi:hypothetical protein